MVSVEETERGGNGARGSVGGGGGLFEASSCGKVAGATGDESRASRNGRRRNGHTPPSPHSQSHIPPPSLPH
jgi:hypothetical protein